MFYEGQISSKETTVDRSPTDVRQFVIAVRTLALADRTFMPASRNARIKLILELEGRLVDPKNRLNVLRAITGLPLSSQNDLTAFYTHVLISEVCNDSKSTDILQSIEADVCERVAETGNLLGAVSLLPRRREVSSVPVLRQASACG